MNLEDLFGLRDGRIDKLLVGRLTSATVSMLGTQTPELYLNRDRLMHIITKCGMKIEDVLLLPDALTRGMLMQEETRPRSFVVCFQHTQIRYKIAVKIVRGGHELWISTMHPTKQGQTKAILGRSRLVRKHR